MLIINDIKADSMRIPRRHLVIAVGNFDGLHLGHQAVIGRAVAIARQQEYMSAVLTFRQHPRSVIEPKNRPLLLLPPEEKIRWIEQMGVEMLFHLGFTAELARMSPEEFIGHILCEELNIAQIVVGEDFRFGRNRRGTLDLLKQLGQRLGFQVTVIPPVRIGDQVVSSTAIRQLLRKGHVREASTFLNRDYEITGTVISGDSRGRLLGFPTANLEVVNELVPMEGVYAVWVVYQGRRYAGMVNIGNRPTFPGAEPSIEVHLIDFNSNLYGQLLSIHFVERVRSQKVFSGPEELRKQLGKDRKHVLEILGCPDTASPQASCKSE